MLGHHLFIDYNFHSRCETMLRMFAHSEELGVIREEALL